MRERQQRLDCSIRTAGSSGNKLRSYGDHPPPAPLRKTIAFESSVTRGLTGPEGAKVMKLPIGICFH